MTKELSNAQFVTDLTNVRAIMERQLGADNINMIYVLRPLAAQLVAQGNYEDAEPVQIAIMELCNRSSSPVLPSRAEAMAGPVRNIEAGGQFQRGKKSMYNELYRAEVLQSGESSEKSLSLLGWGVSCLEQLGRLDEATDKVRAVLELIESSPENYTTGERLCWLNRLSLLLCNQSKFAEAAEVSESTLPLFEAEVCSIPQLDTIGALYHKAGNTTEYERIRARRRELALKYDF